MFQLLSAIHVTKIHWRSLAHNNNKHRMLSIPRPPAPPTQRQQSQTSLSYILSKQQQSTIVPSQFSVLTKIPPPPELPTPVTPPNLNKEAQLLFLSLLSFYLFSVRYVVLDTEATGLGNDHKLTEIGCVEIENLKITGHKFHIRLNPRREVNAEAYKLTGHTWESLRHCPDFKDIIPSFLRFIKGARLIMHNAHYDVKLINEALQDCGHSYGKLEQHHTVLDTLPWARKLYPDEENNLKELCERHNIDTSRRQQHGALIDAELLADVSCRMLRQYDRIFSAHVDLKVSDQADFYNRFEEAKGTDGEKYFRKIGIQGDLPPSFRFVENMVHPQLKRNYPAILVAFTNRSGNIAGIYARYYVSFAELSDITNKTDKVQTPHGATIQNKIFYGSAQNATVDIHPGNPKTVFIGSMLNALVVRDALLLGNDTEGLYNDLRIKDGFSIKALLDITYLPSITFDNRTKRVIFLMDSDGKNDAASKSILTKLVEYFSSCQPPINFEVVMLKTERDGNTTAAQIAKELPEQIAYRIRRTFQVNSLDALSCLNFIGEKSDALDFQKKVEQARRMYSYAKEIKEETPAAKYFQKRGIRLPLPQSFRCLTKVYHPWTEKRLPVTLVPLFKNGTVTGIHRIFYESDGTPLDSQYRKYRKVSLGDAVGIEVDIYKGSIFQDESGVPQKEAGVVLISEGIENALVTRDVMVDVAQSDPALAKQLYKNLDITDVFAVKSCVGVNGLIDIPMESRTHTVVIIADNDGINVDVKQTVRKTIESFLRDGYQIKIVLPQGDEGKKVDLNDVYLNADGTKNTQKVAEILCHAVTINSIEDLGDDHESLQASLQKHQQKIVHLPIEHVPVPKVPLPPVNLKSNSKVSTAKQRQVEQVENLLDRLQKNLPIPTRPKVD